VVTVENALVATAKSLLGSEKGLSHETKVFLELAISDF
jgi:hypothetical protein